MDPSVVQIIFSNMSILCLEQTIRFRQVLSQRQMNTWKSFLLDNFAQFKIYFCIVFFGTTSRENDFKASFATEVEIALYNKRQLADFIVS